MAGHCVAIIAKEPLPGRVKTRLAATVGADRAARLCDAFLRDSLRNLTRVSRAQRCLFFSPIEAEAWFMEVDSKALRIPQPELPFGERLQAGFAQLFQHGFDKVAFIGCDAPHVAAQSVESAFEALEHVDVALGPTDDGGYYLVGLSRPQPGLFDDIGWSTPSVLSDTLERAAALDLEVQLLARSFDIDTAADLERLRGEFASTLPDLCPHTARALDARSV